MEKKIINDPVLIYDEKLKRYRVTRLQARKRYLNTIKPLDELLKAMEW